jgi:hypothetical protein
MEIRGPPGLLPRAQDEAGCPLVLVDAEADPLEIVETEHPADRAAQLGEVDGITGVDLGAREDDAPGNPLVPFDADERERPSRRQKRSRYAARSAMMSDRFSSESVDSIFSTGTPEA